MDEFNGLNRANLLAGNNAGLAKTHFGMPMSLFLSSIYIALVAYLAQAILYIIFCDSFKVVYQTRRVLNADRWRYPYTLLHDRASVLLATYSYRLGQIAEDIGLDAYFFLRYLLFLCFLLGAISLLAVPVLVPLNFTGDNIDSPSSAKGLDRLSWSNISSKNTDRFWAHLVLAAVISIIVCVATRFEIMHYTSKLHRELSNPRTISSAVQGRTALLTGYKGDIDELESYLANFFRRGDAVTHIIPANADRSLTRLTRSRDRLIDKIETLYTRIVYHQQITQVSVDSQSCCDTADLKVKEPQCPNQVDEVTTQLSPLLQFLPVSREFPSTLVRWCSMLAQVQMELLALRESSVKSDSYFLVFQSPLDAQIAYSSLFTEVSSCSLQIHIHPNEVKWNNLNWNFWTRKGLTSLSSILTVLMIVGWAFPVAFTSIVTQITYLAQLVPALGWLHRMHGFVVWFLNSVGAPFLLSLFLSLIPLMFKLFASMKCFVRKTDWNQDIQRWFFVFLFVQVYLVITISSSVIATLYEAILYPTSVPKLLAADLPKAANFFASYIITQGLTISASMLLRIPEMIKYILRVKLLFHSGDSYFRRFSCFYDDLEWASLYPTITNLACITIIYSVTSPMILVFATGTFGFLYLNLKCRVVNCHIATFQSMGENYPLAVFQLYTGLYCMQICLIGLFLLVRDHDGKLPCKTHSIIMTLLVLLTVLLHISTYRMYTARLGHLPSRMPESNSSAVSSVIEEYFGFKTKWSYDNLVPTFGYVSNLKDKNLECSLIHDALRYPGLRSCNDWIWVPQSSVTNRGRHLDLQQLLFKLTNYSTKGLQINSTGRLIISNGSPRLDPAFYLFM